MAGRKKKSKKEQNGQQGLTPYQGDRRSFGAYRCVDCTRTWMSSNSWANCAQNCKICNAKVYPHVQRPLNDPGGLDRSDEKKKHLSELCEKCQQLGRNCRYSRRSKRKNKSSSTRS